MESNQIDGALEARSNGFLWVTRDGREFHVSEMYRPHMMAAKIVLKDWIRKERDPAKRRELKDWVRKFNREISKREREWQKKKLAAR